MSELFDSLVVIYKDTEIAFPSLKSVTLAQWILESARGKSDLATQHLNFGGLKWRDEMLGFANPVGLEVSDGFDMYCKFNSLEKFIAGYWKFLSRSPYNGWEEHAEQSPEAFIRFIGPIYNPMGNVYINHVLELLGEATQRLNDAPAITADPHVPLNPGAPFVIVIDPGHGGTVKIGGSSPNNAKSTSGELEKNWTLNIAKLTQVAVLAKAVEFGKNVKVILTRESDINKGLSTRAQIARDNHANLFLSIHLNGFDKKVRGVETLINSTNVNKAEDRAFAQVVQDNLVAAMNKIDPSTKNLSRYDRRVKEQKLGVLNDIHLGNMESSHLCRACLVEIEFMDVPAVNKLFRLNPSQPSKSKKTAKNRQIVANGLADALIVHV